MTGPVLQTIFVDFWLVKGTATDRNTVGIIDQSGILFDLFPNLIGPFGLYAVTAQALSTFGCAKYRFNTKVLSMSIQAIYCLLIALRLQPLILEHFAKAFVNSLFRFSRNRNA